MWTKRNEPFLSELFKIKLCLSPNQWPWYRCRTEVLFNTLPQNSRKSSRYNITSHNLRIIKNNIFTELWKAMLRIWSIVKLTYLYSITPAFVRLLFSNLAGYVADCPFFLHLTSAVPPTWISSSVISSCALLLIFTFLFPKVLFLSQ